MNKKIVTGTIAVLLIACSAAVASYVTRESMKPHMETSAINAPEKVAPVHIRKVVSNQPTAFVKPGCDDRNIVGTIAGGAVGGIAGSQIGKGNGATAATIGGVAAGALIGNQLIPTRNVTCR